MSLFCAHVHWLAISLAYILVAVEFMCTLFDTDETRLDVEVELLEIADNGLHLSLCAWIYGTLGCESQKSTTSGQVRQG